MFIGRRMVYLACVAGILWVTGPAARGLAQEEGGGLGIGRVEGGRLRGSEPARDRARADVGPGRRHRGRPGEAEHLVRRGRLGRRLEDHEFRHHLGADLRRLRVVLDRLRGRRSEQPPDRLGGHGREQQPAQRGLWRRPVQVRSTAAPASRRSGWSGPSTSPRCSSIPGTRTSSTSPRRGRSGTPAATGGCTRPPTAARPGRPCSRSARTPA